MFTSSNIKTCSRCHRERALKHFGLSSKSPDGHRPDCRDCRSTQSRADYLALTPESRQARYAVTVARKQGIQADVWDYLLANPCADCGESDPLVLEFDHVRGTKVANVSRLVVSGSRDSVWTEIAKCDVVCRNCHMRRTSKQFGWYGYLKASA